MAVNRRTWLLGTGGAAALAGCGFELRRPPAMTFRRLQLAGFAPRSPMAEEIRRQLGDGVQIVELPRDADLVLEALVDRRERVVVSTTVAGQVRELTLRVRLHFRVRTPDGRVLLPTAELLQSRDMTYNETYALAKEQEEEMLLRGMRADVAAQVLRRLASVTP